MEAEHICFLLKTYRKFQIDFEGGKCNYFYVDNARKVLFDELNKWKRK